MHRLTNERVGWVAWREGWRGVRRGAVVVLWLWVAMSAGWASGESGDGAARGGDDDASAGAGAGAGADLDALLGLPGEGTATTGAAESERAAEGERGDARDTGDDETGRAVERAVEEAMTPAQISAEFESAVREMEDVARRLARAYDAGSNTQRMQIEILRKLEAVLEAAKQQQQQQGGGGSSSSDPNARQQDQGAQGNASRPGDPSAQAGGQPSQGQPNGQGTTSAGDGTRRTRPIEYPGLPSMDELRERWGNLPPRLRDELLEGLNESFSPAYRRQTEAYYRRLAEEGNGDAHGGGR